MVKRSLIARPASGPLLSEEIVVYDVIVMDRNMPEMSGIEATLAIRKAGYKGPIIGVSGDIDNGEFVAAGATLVMEKPVAFDEMKKAIAKVMQGSHKSARTKYSHPMGVGRPAVPASTSQRVGQAFSQRVAVGAPHAPPSAALPTRPTRHPSKVAPASTPYPAGASRRRLVTAPATPGVFGNGLVPALLSVVMPQLPHSDQHHAHGPNPNPGHGPGQGSVAPSHPGSIAVSGRGFVALTDSPFATDIHVALGWDQIFSYTLGFIDPRFNTLEMRSAFIEYRRSGLNYKLIVVLGVVTLAGLVSRGSVATLWRLNPAFLVAFLSYLVGSMCMVTSILNRLAVISYRYDIKVLQPYHAAAVAFAKSRFAIAFENGALISFTMCASMYVLARTLQGPCPPHTTVWDEQECNPDAVTHNIPQDTLLFAAMAIISFQVLTSGASKRATAVSWVILLAVVNASMVVVGSSLLVWNNLLLVCGACVSYEFERWVGVLLPSFVISPLAPLISLTTLTSLTPSYIHHTHHTPSHRLHPSRPSHPFTPLTLLMI